MSHQPRIVACLLSLALSPIAFAQATSTESTKVTQTPKSGVVESVAGNKVVLKEADGLHEYTLPDGFKFALDGRQVGVDEIKPGMAVNAVITDTVTTRNVTVTRVASGTVAQVAPGGIVLKDDATGNYKSYNFKDAKGNDIYFARDGQQVALRDVKQGDRLSGTVVTTLPPQVTTQRSAVARATAPAEPAPVVAAATPPASLPKTASPVPLIGLLAVLVAGVALALRAFRVSRLG
jgi:hypothetical protein